MIYDLAFKWGVSKARDTAGYNICSLWVNGKKEVSTCGGGYDMKGTVLGRWIARRFADRLLKLKEADMPEHSHWERSENPRRMCWDADCVVKAVAEGRERPKLGPDDTTCPECGKPTDIDYHDGRTVNDGRYFYGLTFHDPNFDPGKAIPQQPPVFGGEADKGKTVEQLENEGKSLGLERCQQFYRASSKVPTERHAVPLIDGAVGIQEVMGLGNAIGLTFQSIRAGKNDDIWRVEARGWR